MAQLSSVFFYSWPRCSKLLPLDQMRKTGGACIDEFVACRTLVCSACNIINFGFLIILTPFNSVLEKKESPNQPVIPRIRPAS